ncbi:hypothetical protein QR98_0038470 [Sarcoptes scabiei]|uniref:Uncharacterized protein n=1 Tax=Sarcoptes scabiei TaxID=52283 RepID=A0A132A447_SARSC|nr:hypothetical protein QR98_0038470 [Sarcoptes scabiei]
MPLLENENRRQTETVVNIPKEKILFNETENLKDSIDQKTNDRSRTMIFKSDNRKKSGHKASNTDILESANQIKPTKIQQLAILFDSGKSIKGLLERYV